VREFDLNGEMNTNVRSLQCLGNETDITQCSMVTSDPFTQYSAPGVHCFGKFSNHVN